MAQPIWESLHASAVRACGQRIAIATGLAYAGYRVYRGVCSFLSTREANRREMAQRIDFSDLIGVESCFAGRANLGMGRQ